MHTVNWVFSNNLVFDDDELQKAIQNSLEETKSSEVKVEVPIEVKEESKSSWETESLLLQTLNVNYEGILAASKPRGFHNHGNTCYFNSAMQCLVNSKLYAEEYE